MAVLIDDLATGINTVGDSYLIVAPPTPRLNVLRSRVRRRRLQRRIRMGAEIAGWMLVLAFLVVMAFGGLFGLGSGLV